MPTNVINTTEGQTIARELMIAYLNTGTASTPVWSAFGKRVEESSMDYDWSEETKQDILGNVHSTMKKPIITQDFDPCYLDSGDAAVTKIWDLGVKQQDAQALANQDVMVAHFYAGATATPWAERYTSSMVRPTSLGGEGGGNMEMGVSITYGGERTLGTVSKGTGGVITFTPVSE